MRDLVLFSRSSVKTSGFGDTRYISIQTRNDIQLIDSQIFTEGNISDISLQANNITLDDSQILGINDNFRGNGRISLQANNITLDGSQIQELGNVKNISIQAQNAIELTGSKIFTEGNISDISLQANNITLDDSQILGINGNFRSNVFRLSNKSLISLSGSTIIQARFVFISADSSISGFQSLGLTGSIDILLPNSLIDTNALLAQTCLIRQDQPQGTFYVTGTGGIPNRPSDPALSSYPTNTIQPTTQTAQKPWKLGDPIVEPQGFYKLADGRFVMSRECQLPSQDSSR